MNDLITGCLTCWGIIGFLGLLASTVAYIVFGIIFLVDDYHVCHDCTGSNLWAYVLTTLILGIVVMRSSSSSRDKEDNTCIIIFILVVQMSMAIWGGIELFSNSCSDLTKSDIWIWATVAFSNQCFCVFICFCTLICQCCDVNLNSSGIEEIQVSTTPNVNEISSTILVQTNVEEQV